MLCADRPQDTLVAIRVTLPEKDEDTDEPSPAESLQMAVRMLDQDDYLWNSGLSDSAAFLPRSLLLSRLTTPSVEIVHGYRYD